MSPVMRTRIRGLSHQGAMRRKTTGGRGRTDVNMDDHTLIGIFAAVFGAMMLVMLILALRHATKRLLPDNRAEPVRERGTVYPAQLLDREREAILHL